MRTIRCLSTLAGVLVLGGNLLPRALAADEPLVLKGHTKYVGHVVFSPDGKRLASGSGDTTVKVWDAATGQELLTLKGHSQPISQVVFSSDGKRLATAGSYDHTVRVWDAATGKELLTLEGHPEYV